MWLALAMPLWVNAQSLSISAGPTPVVCTGGANGSATVTVSGLTPPYTYTWQKFDPLLLPTPGYVTIAGGSTTISATSDSRSNLDGGSYRVTVLDNSSPSPIFRSVVFDIYEAPVAFSLAPATVTPITCKFANDGIITATASNGATRTGDQYTYVLTGPAMFTATIVRPITSPTATFTNLQPGSYDLTVTDATGCVQSEANIFVPEPTLVSITSVSSTNVTCRGGNNGTANITVTGGNGGYSYRWWKLPITMSSVPYSTVQNPTNLEAGTYTIVVQDMKGCIDSTVNLTITQPATNPTVSLSSTPVSCPVGQGTSNNGTVTITASNGTLPYVYELSTDGGATYAAPVTFGPGPATISTLTAGTYTIRFTDNNGTGCSQVLSETIAAIPPISFSAPPVITHIACRGGGNGAIDISVTGGTPPYTYLWTRTAGTGSAPVLTNEDLLNISMASGTSTTYQVQVTDANGCSAVFSGLTVTQPATLTGIFTVATVRPTCAGDADGIARVTMSGPGSGNNSPFSFVFQDNFGNALANQPTNIGVVGNQYSFQGLPSGDYIVEVTDVNGCVQTRSFSIGSYPPIDITLSSKTSPSACGGGNGAISVTVTGGNASGVRTYEWARFDDISSTFITLATGTVGGGPTVPPTTTLNPTTLGSPNVTQGLYRLTYTDGGGCVKTFFTTLEDPTAATITVNSVTHVLCNGNSTGQIFTSITGGDAPYAIEWSKFDGSVYVPIPSLNNIQSPAGLAAGDYRIRVTDDRSCVSSLSGIMVNEPTALALSFAIDSISCHNVADGGLTALPSGGVGPYSYLWGDGQTSDVVTGLPFGTYSVTVTDANGCTINGNATLINPALLVASISGVVQVDCNGQATGQATAVPTGGTGPFTYTWSTSPVQTTATATGLAGSVSGTTYFVQITDFHGCTDVASVDIFEPVVLAADVDTNTVTVCKNNNNGSIDVTNPSGGSGNYQFRYFRVGDTPGAWSATVPNISFTGLTAGLYEVEIKDPSAVSCEVNLGTFEIKEPDTLLANVAFTDVTTCFGNNDGTITVSGATGGTGTFEYWITGSAWQASGSFTGLVAGTYEVRLRDAANPTCFVILDPALVIDEPDQLAATVTPNDVTVCFGFPNGSIDITGATGGYPGAVYQYSIDGGTTWMPTVASAADYTFAGLNAGTYTVLMRDASNPDPNACQINLGSYVINEPAQLNADSTLTDVTFCYGNNNGRIQFTNPVGGLGTYVYRIVYGTQDFGWSSVPVFDNLYSGSYDLYIGDAASVVAGVPQCQRQLTTVFLSQPDSLTATVSKQDVTVCFGNNNGSITVSNPLNAPEFPVNNLAYAYRLTGPVSSGGWVQNNAGNSVTFNNLTAGSYQLEMRYVSVLVSCERVLRSSIIITEPAQLSAVVTTTNVTGCFGNTNGSIAIASATGGSGQYEYSIQGSTWATNSGANSFTFTNLGAGTYNVRVRDLNNPTCELVLNPNLTLSQPNPISATVNSTPVTTCFGGNDGSITITSAFGGSGSYEYQVTQIPGGSPIINNTGSFLNLTAGNYEVVIRDANDLTCQRVLSTSLAITEPAPMTGVFSSTDETPCFESNNGTVTVSAPGGGIFGNNYQFTITDGTTTFNSPSLGLGGSHVFTGVTAGSWTVSISQPANPGCSRTLGTAFVAEPAQLNATLAPVAEAPCSYSNNGAIDITNPSGGLIGTFYQYSVDGGASWQPAMGVAAGDAYTISPLVAGSYAVVMRDFNATSCTRVIGSVVITQPDSLAATLATTDETPCFDSDNGTIAVTALQGGLTGTSYEFSLDGTNWTSSVAAPATLFTGLTAGTYNVQMRDANAPGCVVNLGNVVINQPAQLSATVSSTNETPCSDSDNGTIAVSALQGGLTGTSYQFSIDNGTSWLPAGGTATSDTIFTGLIAGSYDLYMRDFNAPSCAVLLQTVTITAPAPLAITGLSSTDETPCFESNNGTITVSGASGGSGTFEYSIAPGVWQDSNIFDSLVAGTYNVRLRDKANPSCNIPVGTVTINEPAQLQASASKTDVNFCFGNNDGTITVTGAVGGSGTFQYWITGGNWQDSNVFTNLFAGTYEVRLRDKANPSCEAQVAAALVLNQPAPLDASISSTNVTGCFGNANGSITLSNPTGAPAPGNGTYRYSISGPVIVTDQISPVFSNLPAGTYSVSIRYTDVNISCTRILNSNLVITQPGQLAATVSSANVGPCHGAANGSITVSGATGGSGSYEFSINGGSSYSLSGTFTGLTPAVYSVRMRDAANPTCVVNLGSVTISEPGLLSGNVAVSSVSGCFGNTNGSITVSGVTGGSGSYNYSIDNGATWQPAGGTSATSFLFSNLGAGTYNVAIQDANNPSCTRTLAVNVVITQPAQLNGTPVASNITSCSYSSTGTITVQNAIGGSGSYEYSINGGANWSTSNVFGGLAVGTYNIVIRDAVVPTCVRTLDPAFVLTAPAPIVVNVSGSSNPACFGTATGSITVSATGGVGTFTYSIDGVNFGSSATFGNLAAGSYTITARDGNGCDATTIATLTDPPLVAIQSLSSADPACFGGSNGEINITASGGTGSLSYSVDNGATFQSSGLFTSLTAGTYNIVVADANNCTATAQVVLTQPTELVIDSVTITDVLCFGATTGEIEVIAQGGTAPYSYAINGGAAQSSGLFGGLAAGDYTVVVTDFRGCNVSTGVVTVSQPTELTLALSSIDAQTCNAPQGSAFASVQGGVGPYIYLWSNGDTTDSIAGLVAGNYSVTVTDANGCTVGGNVTIANGPGLVLDVLSVGAGCGGGSTGTATVTVQNGTQPYTYLWSNGETNAVALALPVGISTVTVTDALGCQAIDTVEIQSVANPLTISLSKVDNNCFGEQNGKIFLSISGGTQPYAALWSTGRVSNSVSDSLENLPAGRYWVTVSDPSGCSVSDTIDILSSAQITASFSVSQPVCPSSATGFATPTISGGTGPYTLLWTAPNGSQIPANNLTNVVPGVYELEITDATGCRAETTVTIPSVAPRNLSVVANGPLTFCEGGQVNLNAVSAGFSNYRWFRNGTPTGQNTTAINVFQSGTYRVVAFDGCQDVNSQEFTIVVNTNPAIPSIAQSNDTLRSTVVADTYQWFLNGSPISGATSQTLIASTPNANYRVVIGNANGCTSTSTEFFYQPTGVAEELELSLQLFPNPTQQLVHLKGDWTPFGAMNVEVYDVLGTKVMDQTINGADLTGGVITLDLGNFATGMYSIRLTTGKQVWSGKVVKQ